MRPHLGPCFYEPVTPEQNEATKKRRAELSERKRQGLPRNSGPPSISAPSSAVNTPDRATTCAQGSPVPASSSPSRQNHPNYQPDPRVPISGQLYHASEAPQGVAIFHPIRLPDRSDSREALSARPEHVFATDDSGSDSSVRQPVNAPAPGTSHGSPRLQSTSAPSMAVETPNLATASTRSATVPSSTSPSRQHHSNLRPDTRAPMSGGSPHPVPSPGRGDSRDGPPPELQHVFIIDVSGPDSSARQSIEGQELDIGHVYVRDVGIQVGSPRLAFRQPVQEPTLGLKTRTVGTQAPALLPAAPRHSCPPQRQLVSTQEEHFLQQLQAQYWSHVQRRGQDQKRRLSQRDSFAEESSKKLRHLTSAQMQQQRPPFPSQQQQPLAPRKQISPFPYRAFPTQESQESPQKPNMIFADQHQERRITAEEEYDQARRHTLDQYHQKVVSAVVHQQDLQECKAPAVAAGKHSHQGSLAKEQKPEVNSAPSDAHTSLKRSSSPSVLHKDAVLAPPRKLPKDVPAFAVERYQQWLGATQRQPGWPIGQRARRYSA